ncbi:MAG: hypothetical protein ACAI34_18905 [Verrucomicrobium sp.]|nr:hypothetical protein [Verrucomicrobium sp.]
MKTLFPILIAALAAAAPLKGSDPYEVHEWGTLTQVTGSDGRPLPWYQPLSDLATLPPFVGTNPLRSKAQSLYTLRMETPVLYFYPKTALTVKVRVSFNQGAITEWYPQPVTFGAAAFAAAGQSVLSSPYTEWKVDLLPPSDATALAQIPAVPPGQGQHYAHAREVPDAWIARSNHSTAGLQADKFIFYRGGAEFAIPVVTEAVSDSKLFLRNHLPEALPAAYVLRVQDDKAYWMRLGALEPFATALDPTKVTLSAPDKPLIEAATAMGTAMLKDLTEAGLTAAEAAAMVATWQDSWFKEPGTRVLCLLPEKYVDQILPLQLTPAPNKVKRVFVARLEIFTPAQESRLAMLLDQSLTAPKEQRQELLAKRAEDLQALQLGRFGAAGLERAVAMKRNALQSAYFELEAELTKVKKTTASTKVNAVSAR